MFRCFIPSIEFESILSLELPFKYVDIMDSTLSSYNFLVGIFDSLLVFTLNNDHNYIYNIHDNKAYCDNHSDLLYRDNNEKDIQIHQQVKYQISNEEHWSDFDSFFH